MYFVDDIKVGGVAIINVHMIGIEFVKYNQDYTLKTGLMEEFIYTAIYYENQSGYFWSYSERNRCALNIEAVHIVDMETLAGKWVGCLEFYTALSSGSICIFGHSVLKREQKTNQRVYISVLVFPNLLRILLKCTDVTTLKRVRGSSKEMALFRIFSKCDSGCNSLYWRLSKSNVLYLKLVLGNLQYPEIRLNFTGNRDKFKLDLLKFKMINNTINLPDGL